MPYGGSISQVAAGDQAMDAQTRAAYEHMLDRLVQQHSEQQKNDLTRQQMQMQGSQFDRSLTSKEQEELAQRAERAREFNTTEKGKGEDFDKNFNQRQQYQDWLMKQPTGGDQKQYQVRMNGALLNAQAGKYGTWEDVMNDFPDMHPEDASVILGQSHAARETLQSNYDFANNAAGVMNRLSNLQQQLKAKNKSVVENSGWHMPFLTEGSRNPGAVYATKDDISNELGTPEIQQQIDQLTPWATRIQTDKRFDTLLNQDPNTGKWQTTQRLPWLPQRPGQPVPAPTPAPTPVNNNPYTVGKLYQGNLRYKGGDPSDQNSWQQE